ncbi:MAG: hypothetical protein ACRDF9_00230 [Candidatus Limnocylindria bacterium]
MSSARGASLPLFVAIFFLSFAALLFQFVQTRMFSTMLDHHLTFLVVSGALLGVAGAGTAAAVVDVRARRPSSAQLSVAAAIATLVALAIETRIDPRAAGMFVAAGAAYVLGVIPVLCVSWVIVRALRETPEASGALYAADLAGAASGGVVGYLTIGTLGAQGLYGAVAGISLLAAAALLAPGPARLPLRAGFAVVAIVATAALSLWGEALAPPRPGPLKAGLLSEPHEFARWDPLARVDIARRFGPLGDTGDYAFFIDHRYAGPRPPALFMTLDMTAYTPILARATDAELAVLEASLLAAPYALAPRDTVLIIGPGGGIDVLTALRHNATSVTAVEVNRTEVALMRGPYAEYSGGVYLDPRVHVFEDEARSFIRRSPDRYDVMVMTVVDSFAALTAGAYALTENYLYTEEAMFDYVSHLTAGGVMALSRWYLDPPVQMIQTVNIADRALRRLGREHPERSIAVLRHGTLGMVLVRNDEFTPSDMLRLRTFVDRHGFSVALDPLAPSGALVTDAARAPVPPTDDKPFFFDTVPLSDLFAGREQLPYGYAVLLMTLVVSLALAVVVALLPLYRGARLAAGHSIPPGTMVALALGAGFIAAELVLLQRLTLYLGQPALALSIGLAALLGGAALGSAVSSRVPAGVRAAAVASAVVLLAVLGGLPLVTSATLAAPLAIRVSIATLAALAVGIPLGTIFPRLVALVGHPALVSWVWAVNGTASVVGATLGTMVALLAGFTGLGVVAVACYAIAAVFAPRRNDLGRPVKST